MGVRARRRHRPESWFPAREPPVVITALIGNRAAQSGAAVQSSKPGRGAGAELMQEGVCDRSPGCCDARRRRVLIVGCQAGVFVGSWVATQLARSLSRSSEGLPGSAV